MIRLLPVTLVAILVGGCVAPTRITNSAVMDNHQIVLVGLPNIATTSAVRVRPSRLQSGQLQVDVQLIKQWFPSKFVDVQVTFLDADGFQIEQTNWQPVHLETHNIVQHSVASIGTGAVDFRVAVRRPPK